jgi:hypothetical protein
VTIEETCVLLTEAVRDVSLWRGRANDLEAERDSYREWSIVLMGEVFRLTQRSKRQTETIIRLNTIIRDYLKTPDPQRERRAA